MEVIIIADHKDFFDITDTIPVLMDLWKSKGVFTTKEEVVATIMHDLGCNKVFTGKSWMEAIEKLLAERGEMGEDTHDS